jgi:Na+/H+-dicarboxylate symporter
MTPIGWIRLGVGAIAGGLIGGVLPPLAVRLGVVANLYQRLTESLVAPAVFSAALLILSNTRAAGSERRPGVRRSRSWQMLVLTTAAAAVTVLSALAASDRAGVSIQTSTRWLVEQIVPESVIGAAVQSQTLQVLFWTAILARALSQVPAGVHGGILRLGAGFAVVTTRLIGFAAALAPVGLGAGVASSIGRGNPRSGPGLQLAVMTLTLALLLLCDTLCRSAEPVDVSGGLDP